MTRVTIIYAPHPDDETLYLGSYITVCRARGDKLILVAATDGGSSGAIADGWTPDDLCRIRIVEQESSWRNLTGLGPESIIRMGSIDSKDPGLRDKVHGLAEDLEAEYVAQGYDVEHYAACNNGRSQGVDHDAVALGLRDSLVRVKRFANRCTETVGTIYKPPAAELARMQKADTCFEAFGHRSVASYWQALRDSGYTNRVVA